MLNLVSKLQVEVVSRPRNWARLTNHALQILQLGLKIIEDSRAGFALIASGLGLAFFARTLDKSISQKQITMTAMQLRRLFLSDEP